MNEETELPPDIARLLAEEARDVALPEGTRERLLARLATSIPDLSGPPHGSGGGGGAPARATGAGAAAASIGVAKIAPIALAFLAGAGTTVAVMRATTPPPAERIVYVDRPAAPPTSTSPPPPTASAIPLSALPAAQATAATTSVGTSPRAPASGASSFVEERLALDEARTALARGDHEAALTALAAHEKKHPSGALAEEREALYVRVLAEAGRLDPARARADRFRARWPRSVLLPAVEAAVAPPP